jgi:hypothetical protein
VQLRLRAGAFGSALVILTIEVTSLGPAGRTSILIMSGSHSLTVPVDIFAGTAHRFEAKFDGALIMKLEACLISSS